MIICFQRPAVLVLKHTQDFYVAVSGATKVIWLKLPWQSHLKILTLKYERLNDFRLDLKLRGSERAKQFNSLKLLLNFSNLVIHMASKSAKCD